MILHDLDPKREDASLGPHHAHAHAPAVRGNVDCGNVAMHIDGSAISQASWGS